MQIQTKNHKTIYLADYKPTEYEIETIDLNFDLLETHTRVDSKLVIKRKPNAESAANLVLNGEKLKLVSLKLNGENVEDSRFRLDESSLTLYEPGEQFTLEVGVEINPAENKALTGLYLSGGNYCTQCEAEDFRRITYMYDRPDVMTCYTVTITADKEKYPVLLSNGNLLDSGSVSGDENRHWARWQDPFPKPTYLFALVAGDLACIEDRFTTMSGRTVDLQLYVQHHNVDKTAHAMRSLKRAMEWDEQVYGREYDLDVYMIVAVDDFNMGAMENKGLNIFNSKYVLAKANTATDIDFQNIEGVIGHEYFHNWSGNRVTCRDWFQLSLKEGFTVFRDQEFSADMCSRGVKRIADVDVLRNYQFKEDAGPMAHPVRPDSYVEINNFYTVTIYNKGAEVVRMLYHLLGAERFRKGTDLYFERHDGQAVTTDDFVKALEDANDVDFSQFRLWYTQAGTPLVKVSSHYDAEHKSYTLQIEQTCPNTPGQSNKAAFHIPFAIGLISASGKPLIPKLSGATVTDSETLVLELKNDSQSFTFIDLDEEPIPSLLREFSAPVKVEYNYTDQQRCFLMAHDKDDFNRWDSAQQLAVKLIMELSEAYQNNQPMQLNDRFVDAVANLLGDTSCDPALVAQAIRLPTESYIGDSMTIVQPKAIYEARLFVRRELATRLKSLFLQVYHDNSTDGAYSIDQKDVARRSLKNRCLLYLMETRDEDVIKQCVDQFDHATNMTDAVAALVALTNTPCDQRDYALRTFYEKWRDDNLVIDKWLAIQASSELSDTLERVESLTQHEAFNINNPNKVRSLISVFGSNEINFHRDDGKGYEFLGKYIKLLDKQNPQVAAHLAGAFSFWKRYEQNHQQMMQLQLNDILQSGDLSKDVYEVISKSLSN